MRNNAYLALIDTALYSLLKIMLPIYYLDSRIFVKKIWSNFLEKQLKRKFPLPVAITSTSASSECCKQIYSLCAYLS